MKFLASIKWILFLLFLIFQLSEGQRGAGIEVIPLPANGKCPSGFFVTRSGTCVEETFGEKELDIK